MIDRRFGDDPGWTKHPLGDDTSVNVARNGTILIKQTTNGHVETVHLSWGHVARLWELVRSADTISSERRDHEPTSG